MNPHHQIGIFSFYILIFLFSCNSVYIPNPVDILGLTFRIMLIGLLTEANYPYSFEYPTYANIIRDTSFFGDRPENPYWINIDFPRFHARIYISYKEVNGNYNKLREDAYKMTYKHTYKASSIEDSLISTPLGVHGIFFNVGGDAATAKQFFVSDSTRHFLRGALYFDTTPNADSLGIVNHFSRLICSILSIH